MLTVEVEELLKPLDVPIDKIENVPPLRKPPANRPVKTERYTLWSTRANVTSFTPDTESGCIFSPTYSASKRKGRNNR